MSKMKHVNVQLTPDVYNEMRETVPWGLRGQLIDRLLHLVVDAIREDGPIVIGAILAGEYKLALARIDRSEPVQNLNKNETIHEPTG